MYLNVITVMIEASDAFVAKAAVLCPRTTQDYATPLTHKCTIFWRSFCTKILTVSQCGCDHRTEQDNKEDHRH